MKSSIKHLPFLLIAGIFLFSYNGETASPNVKKPSLGEIASSPYRSHERIRGIVLHFIMAEGSGTLLRNGQGRGIPSNDGTLINMEPSIDWVPGPFGYALDFDGVDERVDIDLSGKGIFGTAARTISLWFNADVFPTDATDFMFVQSARGSVAGDQLFIAAEDNGVSVGFTSARIIFDRTILNTNEWIHFALAIPASSDTDNVRGYINGVEKTFIYEAGSNQTIDTFDDSDASVAGRGGGTPSSFFNGRLDEVRVYNRALNPGEIKSVYTNPFIESRQPKRNFLEPAVAALPPSRTLIGEGQ